MNPREPICEQTPEIQPILERLNKLYPQQKPLICNFNNYIIIPTFAS